MHGETVKNHFKVRVLPVTLSLVALLSILCVYGAVFESLK